MDVEDGIASRVPLRGEEHQQAASLAIPLRQHARQTVLQCLTNLINGTNHISHTSPNPTVSARSLYRPLAESWWVTPASIFPSWAWLDSVAFHRIWIPYEYCCLPNVLFHRFSKDGTNKLGRISPTLTKLFRRVLSVFQHPYQVRCRECKQMNHLSLYTTLNEMVYQCMNKPLNISLASFPISK